MILLPVPCSLNLWSEFHYRQQLQFTFRSITITEENGLNVRERSFLNESAKVSWHSILFKNKLNEVKVQFALSVFNKLSCTRINHFLSLYTLPTIGSQILKTTHSSVSPVNQNGSNWSISKGLYHSECSARWYFLHIT